MAEQGLPATRRLDPLTAYDDDPVGGTVHHPFSAFNQGDDAQRAGHPIGACPYRQGDRREQWWREGWHNAASETTGGPDAR